MQLTPELEARIIAFAETWAKNTFHKENVKAHISRNAQGEPQYDFYNRREEDQPPAFEVCIDMHGFGDIRNTQVVVDPSEQDGLSIDDSAGGDHGCATCQYGQQRAYDPD